jgi:hypothetical protein
LAPEGDRTEEAANLAVFGVLMAVLLAVIVFVVFRRRH